MERLVRLEVQLILRFEPRARNIIHARPERVRSRLFFFFFWKLVSIQNIQKGRRWGAALRFGIARAGRA